MGTIDYVNVGEFVFKHIGMGMVWAMALDITFSVVGTAKLWVNKYLGG